MNTEVSKGEFLKPGAAFDYVRQKINISTPTFNKWVREGLIKKHSFGSVSRFSRSDLDNFLGNK